MTATITASPDECDLADGSADDRNADDVPDVCQPGDVDGDRDVDLADHLAAQRCYSGAGVEPPTADCAFFDFDDDRDVDLADLVALQSYIGPAPR